MSAATSWTTDDGRYWAQRERCDRFAAETAGAHSTSTSTNHNQKEQTR